eukprot:3715144-Amphidinium_carterae.1
MVARGTSSNSQPVAPLHSQPGASVPVSTSSKRPQHERQHQVRDGRFVVNRKGIEICRAFQDGSCGGSTPNNRCPRDSSRSHQCNKCLSVDHGSVNCPSDKNPAEVKPSQPPAVRRARAKAGRPLSASSLPLVGTDGLDDSVQLVRTPGMHGDVSGQDRVGSAVKESSSMSSPVAGGLRNPFKFMSTQRRMTQ